MHHQAYLPVIALMIFSLSCLAAEDVLELRDGRLLRGTYAGGTQSTIRFDAAGAVQVLALTDVVALTIGSRATPPPPAAPVAAAQPVAVPAPAPATAAPAGAPVVVTATGKGTAPIGTALLFRTKDPIDSRKQGTGSRFTGTLEGDLVIDGQTLLARGSTIYGQISSSKPPGRLLGKSEMVLVLTGVLIDGQIVPLVTGAAVMAGQEQGKDTAKKVAAGALIGGAIDGKDGAGKGAMAGGAAALLGRGGSLQVAPGTLLEFKLAQPFTR